MTIYNVGFMTNDGKTDETQLDISEHDIYSDELVEFMNLVLGLREEMNIKELLYIDYVQSEEEEK